MRISVYTRGHRRKADHRFIGPEAELWWTGSIGYWLNTGKATVLARQRAGQFETVLCGLPTSRRVEDGSPIANMVFLSAPMGSDDAQQARVVASTWLADIHRSDGRSSDLASAVDSAIDAEVVAAELGSGVESKDVMALLDRLASELVTISRARSEESGQHAVNPARSRGPGGAAPDGNWMSSLTSDTGRDELDRTLRRMSEGPNGSDSRAVAAYLNLADDQQDARQAWERLGGTPAAFLVAGTAYDRPVPLDDLPKAEAIDRRRRLTDRLTTRPWRACLTRVGTVILIVVVLAALASRVW